MVAATSCRKLYDPQEDTETRAALRGDQHDPDRKLYDPQEDTETRWRATAPVQIRPQALRSARGY